MNSPRLHGPVLTDEPVTVVTVGVRGIGAGIAAALCRTGYRTVAFDRLEQTTATARLEHVVVDMAPSSAVEKAVGTVLGSPTVWMSSSSMQASWILTPSTTLPRRCGTG